MMPVWLALLLVALFGFVCGGGGAFVFWAFVTGDLRKQIARLEEIRDLQSAEVAIRDHALYVAHRFDRLEGVAQRNEAGQMVKQHPPGVDFEPSRSELEKTSERFQEGTRRLRATERDRYPQ